MLSLVGGHPSSIFRISHGDRAIDGEGDVVLFKDRVTEHSSVQVHVIQLGHLDYSLLGQHQSVHALLH